MKQLLICFLLFLGIQKSYSQEIELLCKGSETQLHNTSTPEIVKRTYELTFDDKKNILTSFTSRLSAGCGKIKEDYTSTKCECNVTSNEISCSSEEIRATGREWKTEDSFRINRKTGRMTTYMMSGNAKDLFTYIGELNCEKFDKNKF